jgi:hypothetical protein
MVFLAPFWQGCGLDPPKKPIPPPPLPPFPPESPQDVIDNMEYAYNQMDYERYQPLILDGFIFVFNQEDVENFPDDIPPSGVWGQSEELTSAEHMLDPNFIPEDDPDLKIDNMQLELQFSGQPEPTNLQGAPPEALEAFVTFDLRVDTVGETDYLVNSRPEFYFAHAGTLIAGTDTTYTWGIWQISDAPFGQPTN